MRKRTLALGAAMVMSLGMAAPALALHPPHGFPNEPIIPPHQHYINGQRVGPNACQDGPSIAFDHFHLNVHLGKPGHDISRGDGTGGQHLVTAVFPCPSS